MAKKGEKTAAEAGEIKPRKPSKKAVPSRLARTTQGAKPKKEEPVRGRFSMPKDDYDLIAKLKAIAKSRGSTVKKNVLLGAGLRALARMSDDELATILGDSARDKQKRADDSPSRGRQGILRR